MKTRFIFSLTVTLWSLGLTQPALSATSVLILQCSVAGTAFEPTAASEGERVRDVVFRNNCARELEEYLNDGFKFKSTLGDKSASIVTYTLIRSP
ncbi:MAG: hypothetical protein ACREV1_06580 [Gammaproteobacteria bacterium]